MSKPTVTDVTIRLGSSEIAEMRELFGSDEDEVAVIASARIGAKLMRNILKADLAPIVSEAAADVPRTSRRAFATQPWPNRRRSRVVTVQPADPEKGTPASFTDSASPSRETAAPANTAGSSLVNPNYNASDVTTPSFNPQDIGCTLSNEQIVDNYLRKPPYTKEEVSNFVSRLSGVDPLEGQELDDFYQFLALGGFRTSAGIGIAITHVGTTLRNWRAINRDRDRDRIHRFGKAYEPPKPETEEEHFRALRRQLEDVPED